MSKRKNNTSILKRENIIRRLRIFLIAVLVIILFYPPYLQGLFFEKHVLPTEIIVFITFIIFLVYKYKWLKNDSGFFKTPIEYACFGFVIVYFISIFVAVHTRSAIIEWLKYCMYFAVFYMISDLADNQKTKLLFLWTIIISAFGVSVIGLDAAFGGNFVRILNKFFNQLGVKGDLFFGLYSNNRIHSTLQYANALASYLMAVFFVTVGLLMFYNKWWQKAILGAISYILFLTFMLTHSRGAQLLLPVVVIILFLVAPKYNKINLVTHTLLLALPAGITSLLVSPFLSADTFNKKALFLIITGLFVTVILSLLVRRIGTVLQKVNWRIYVSIILVITIIIGMGIYHVFNSYVPVELSLLNSQNNEVISFAKDITLKPNKKYILRFEAEGKMLDDKPNAFFVRIFNKNLKNILFYGSEQLVRRDFPATNGFEEFSIAFNTKEDTKLININFSIYYSGTSVNINNAYIIDAETGKTEKVLMLKNKYNLDNIISRFQNIWLQQSLISRAIFYKDGLNIFKDYWFLGAGGGAWNYLYRQYQSYNYSSSQAHNYPLQLGIETGMLGVCVLICLISIIIISYKKYYKKNKCDYLSATLITSIASLFIHSVIDFDFAEGSMLLLFWSFVALLNRDFISSIELEELRLFNFKKTLKKSNNIGMKKHKCFVFGGIVFSLVALYFSSTFYIASYYAKQSFKSLQKNDIETAINKIEKAVKWDRYNEAYVIGYNPISYKNSIKAGLIDILLLKNEIYKSIKNEGGNISEAELSLFQKQFSKALLYLKNTEKKADNNLNLSADLASFYFKMGDIDKVMSYLNSALTYFPFEPSLWHSKINIYLQLMEKYFKNGDFEKAKEYLMLGLSVIDEAKNVNRNNLNPFVFNSNTIESLQTLKFLEKYWSSKAFNTVNKIIHYSLFDLDVNMDGIPDQWKLNNVEIMNNISSDKGVLSVKVLEGAYLHSNYPIKLEKGKSYTVELETKDDVKSLYLYVENITPKALPFIREGNKYIAEFNIDSEPNENGHEFRIYIGSDCVIENIFVMEKGNL